MNTCPECNHKFTRKQITSMFNSLPSKAKAAAARANGAKGGRPRKGSDWPVIRETKGFVTRGTGDQFLVQAKGNAYPKRKILGLDAWNYLRTLNDASFDGACVLDFGLGVFQRKAAR